MTMKTAVPFLFVALLIISSSLVASGAEAIEVVEPPKYKNLFTLRTEKQFVGAQVEVYNSRGELITSQSLQKRKMIIDFGEARFGTYTIRIVKGQSKKEFKYIKK
jgi:hypothetical protein